MLLAGVARLREKLLRIEIASGVTTNDPSSSKPQLRYFMIRSASSFVCVCSKCTTILLGSGDDKRCTSKICSSNGILQRRDSQRQELTSRPKLCSFDIREMIWLMKIHSGRATHKPSQTPCRTLKRCQRRNGRTAEWKRWPYLWKIVGPL